MALNRHADVVQRVVDALQAHLRQAAANHCRVVRQHGAGADHVLDLQRAVRYQVAGAAAAAPAAAQHRGHVVAAPDHRAARRNLARLVKVVHARLVVAVQEHRADVQPKGPERCGTRQIWVGRGTRGSGIVAQFEIPEPLSSASRIAGSD